MSEQITRDGLQAGDKVVIRFNPHHGLGCAGVIGTIVQVRPYSGFAGCDLVDVRYLSPEGEIIRPFDVANVQKITPECAKRIAAEYTAKAKPTTSAQILDLMRELQA